MASAAGFTCDYCHAFAIAVKNGSSVELPAGWITVHPRTKEGERMSLEVCGNHCLANLGATRWEADHEGLEFARNSQKGRRFKGTREK